MLSLISDRRSGSSRSLRLVVCLAALFVSGVWIATAQDGFSDYDVFIVMDPVVVPDSPEDKPEQSRGVVEQPEPKIQFVRVRTDDGKRNRFHLGLPEEVNPTDAEFWVVNWRTLSSPGVVRTFTDGRTQSTESGSTLVFEDVPIEPDLLGLVELEITDSREDRVVAESVLVAADAVVVITASQSRAPSEIGFDDSRAEAYEAHLEDAWGLPGDRFEGRLHIFGLSSHPSEGLPGDLRWTVELVPTEGCEIDHSSLPWTVTAGANGSVLFEVSSMQLTEFVPQGIPFTVLAASGQSVPGVRHDWVRASVRPMNSVAMVERLKEGLRSGSQEVNK